MTSTAATASAPLPDSTVTLPAAVLARWQMDTTDASATTVLPDGCSDLILHINASGHAGWHISPLADAAMLVPGCAGEHWLGYRFAPGAVVDAGALLQAAQAIWQQAGSRAGTRAGWQNTGLTRGGAALDALLREAIDRHTRIDPRVQEALRTLAIARNVAAAAQSLGVSERSLERLTQCATGQPPRFWRALARVRRAAQSLATAQPLAEIAVDQGYADQAHFSRDCLRWLGLTPAALRRAPALLATVAQAGHG